MNPFSARLIVSRRMEAKRRVALAAVDVTRNRGRSKKWNLVEGV